MPEDARTYTVEVGRDHEGLRLDRFLADQLAGGQVFALFVIAVAAAEVGIGLAIVLLIFRNRQNANIDELDLMKL